MKQARLIHISGTVQGVGFRAFTAACGQREGISGYARNMETGKVEVIAYGEKEALDRFQQNLQHGHAVAQVTTLTSKLIEHSGAVSGFLIV